jgi:hypothetical protein
MHVLPGFISHQATFGINLGKQNRFQGGSVGALHMVGLHTPSTLNQAEHLFLVSEATVTRSLFALVADVGVSCASTILPLPPTRSIFNTRMQAVGHKPRRLIGDFEGTVELMTGNAFLAGSEQVGGLQPFV